LHHWSGCITGQLVQQISAARTRLMHHGMMRIAWEAPKTTKSRL